MDKRMAGWCLGVVVVCSMPSVACALTYEVDVKLQTALAYKNMDVNVSYAATSGSLIGIGENVACLPNAALNVVSAFNDCELTTQDGCSSAKQLLTALATNSTVTGPIVLFTCHYSGASAPTVSQFVVTIDDWAATHTTPPIVVISRIQQIP